MKMSVILATHNGAHTLERTLSGLAEANLPEGGVQFIVIDNASTDATPDIISKWRERLGLTVLREPRKGKSYALNHALSKAQGQLIVFVDDDVLVDADWLVAFAAAADAHPEIGLFAGQIRHFWEVRPPRWLEDLAAAGKSYAGTPVDRVEGPIEPGYIKGANMMVRRSALGDVRFCEEEGVNFIGTGAMTGGEDTRFAHDVMAAGSGSWFTPEARLRHIVRPDQIGLRPVAHRYFRIGRSLALADPNFYGPKPATVLGYPVKAIRAIARQAAGLGYRLLCGDTSMAAQRMIEIARHAGRAHGWRTGRRAGRRRAKRYERLETPDVALAPSLGENAPGVALSTCSERAESMTSIIVGPATVSVLEDRVRVSRPVAFEPFPRELWFEVRGDIDPRIDASAADWAALALIQPAMLHGRDLRIEGALSPRLLRALRTDVQSLLKLQDPRLQHVRVSAEEWRPLEDFRPPKGVATGFSAGVDSFATLRQVQGEDTPPSLRLTHLCLHDVGAIRGGPDHDEIFAARLDRVRRMADELGIGTYSVASNAFDFIRCERMGPGPFERVHSLLNGAAAHLMAGAIGVYYYASAYPYNKLNYRKGKDLALIDPVFLPLISSERLTIISACAALSRIEKTALIATYPPSRRMLDVCTADGLTGGPLNCGDCEKCVRQLIIFDALDMLDEYAEVFDIAAYRRRRNFRIASLMLAASRGSGDTLNDHALRELAARKSIPLMARLRYLELRWLYGIPGYARRRNALVRALRPARA